MSIKIIQMLFCIFHGMGPLKFDLIPGINLKDTLFCLYLLFGLVFLIQQKLKQTSYNNT